MQNIKLIVMILISFALISAGCNAGQNNADSDPNDEMDHGREIIAELEQTVEETPKRDEMAKRVLENPQYVDESREELSPEKRAEILTVEHIEEHVATRALEQVYDLLDFYNEGIMFLEEGEDPGFWIGIKEPDERVDQLVEILQDKVDKGEILAEYIHIYRSEYSEKDVSELGYKVKREVRKIAEEESDGVGRYYSISIDLATRDIRILHTFLTDEEMNRLKEKFPDYNIDFVEDEIDIIDA